MQAVMLPIFFRGETTDLYFFMLSIVQMRGIRGYAQDKFAIFMHALNSFPLQKFYLPSPPPHQKTEFLNIHITILEVFRFSGNKIIWRSHCAGFMEKKRKGRIRRFVLSTDRSITRHTLVYTYL